MKDFIVRIVLLLVVVVAVMVWVGWVRFDRTPDRATIEVNTGEMERAASKAVQAGKELAEDAGETIHEATEPVGDRPDRTPETPAAPAPTPVVP